MGTLEGEIPENIRDLGFTITNSIKLLGFSIPNRCDIVTANFDPIKTKIRSIIRYWDLFYLSLQGKITVYKTLLLPQLNYIGTIPENIIRDIRLNGNFRNTRIPDSKKKAYTEPEQGGLGLFELKDFITALQCTWIKRAFTHCVIYFAK